MLICLYECENEVLKPYDVGFKFKLDGGEFFRRRERQFFKGFIKIIGNLGLK